jgi:shikimate dehydrogenase
MLINGRTEIIAHIGYPTDSFQSPMIYNPYFEKVGVNAVVVPMGCRAEDYPAFLRCVFKLENVSGALITMPHKATTVDLLDEATPMVRIAGSCNAVRRNSSGQLSGDIFDGEGFVRGLARKSLDASGRRALVVGTGGAGSAIAASLAQAGVGELALFDTNTASSEALAARLRKSRPSLKITTGSSDPADFDLVVNATPLGMKEGDPLPMDVSRILPSTWVGDVVLKSEMTQFLAAATKRGCTVQSGLDMLFEQIPAYLEFFGLPATTPEKLRELALLT